MARKTTVAQSDPMPLRDSAELDGATLAALVGAYDTPTYAILRGALAQVHHCTNDAIDTAVWNAPDMAHKAQALVSLTDALQSTADALMVYRTAVKSALDSQCRGIQSALDIAAVKYADWCAVMDNATAQYTALGARVAVRARRNGQTVQTAQGQSVDGQGKGRGNARIERKHYKGRAASIWRGLTASVGSDGIHATATIGASDMLTVDLPLRVKSDGTVDFAKSTLDAIRWYVIVLHSRAVSKTITDAAYWGTSFQTVIDPKSWTGKLSDVHGDGALDWRLALTMDLSTTDFVSRLLTATGALSGVNQYTQVWADIDAYVPVAPRD